eukprot:scaffold4587_cov182-Amphora_coffeaeformis.AAC.7
MGKTGESNFVPPACTRYRVYLDCGTFVEHEGGWVRALCGRILVPSRYYPARNNLFPRSFFNGAGANTMGWQRADLLYTLTQLTMEECRCLLLSQGIDPESILNGTCQGVPAIGKQL